MKIIVNPYTSVNSQYYAKIKEMGAEIPFNLDFPVENLTLQSDDNLDIIVREIVNKKFTEIWFVVVNENDMKSLIETREKKQWNNVIVKATFA